MSTSVRLACACVLAIACDNGKPPQQEPGPTEHCGQTEFADANPTLCFGGCKDASNFGSPDCVPCESAPSDPLCGGGGSSGGPGSGSTSGTDPSTTGTGESTGGSTGGSELRVVQIEAGAEMTCARISDGAIRCWGIDSFGLGYGMTGDIGDNETPADVGDVPLGGTAIDMDVDYNHVCVVLDDGGVKCWGQQFSGALGMGNGVGQVGTGDTPADYPPLYYNPGAADPLNDPPPANIPRAVQVATGFDTTCALLDNDAVWCWGNGPMVSTTVMTPIGTVTHASVNDLKMFTPAATEIANCGATACVRTATGGVRCWGPDFPVGASAGALGYGHAVSELDHTTVPDVMVGAAVQKLDAARFHVCALTDVDDLQCWGRNTLGQLGLGNIEDVGENETPASAGPAVVGGPVRDFCTGLRSTCAVLQDGTVRCFGANQFGELGYGHTNPVGGVTTPDAEPALDFAPRAVEQVACGTSHSCALFDDGGVRCWGRNDQGQLGVGNTNDVLDAVADGEDAEVL